MHFSEVALDTSLLATPTVRRFFMAAWELQGLTVPVLPRVVRELHGVMADNERRNWIRVLAGQASRGVEHDPNTTNRVLVGVAEATRRWVRDALDAQQEGDLVCALKTVRLGDKDTVRALELADAFPSECFKGPSLNDHYGDREIIGQAAVAGYRVLAMNNRRSIRRASANLWLREYTGVNDDLLRDPDDTVHNLHAPAGAQQSDINMLKAVLLACLPEQPRETEREDEIVTQFLSRLASAGLGDCAAGMERTWTTKEGRELAAEVRERHLPGSVARATEASRVRTVRAAAKRSGWQDGR